jgi:hypothetical protein
MTRRQPDAETLALSRAPRFHELIAEARADAAADLSLDELKRQMPLDVEDERFAQTYDAALQNLERAQARPVADDQARLIRTVLVALRTLPDQDRLDQLARGAGIPVRSIQAVAAALRAGLPSERPVALDELPRPSRELGPYSVTRRRPEPTAD